MIAEEFVTADDTGIVHYAPGFGEDDFQACAKREVIDIGNPPCTVDDNNRLVHPVTYFEGLYLNTQISLLNRISKIEEDYFMRVQLLTVIHSVGDQKHH